MWGVLSLIWPNVGTTYPILGYIVQSHFQKWTKYPNLGYLIHMPVTVHSETIYELAEGRHGYFTSAEAKRLGISAKTLEKMVARGILERLSHGVYRLARYPVFRHGQYVEAVLWPRGATGVLSHESALLLQGLTDASPSKVHITVPLTHRVRRAIPKYLVVHRASLSPDEIEVLDGIPVTRPVRTIRDSHTSNLAPALVRQALEEGRATGRLTMSELAMLREEFSTKNDSLRP